MKQLVSSETASTPRPTEAIRATDPGYGLPACVDRPVLYFLGKGERVTFGDDGSLRAARGWRAEEKTLVHRVCATFESVADIRFETTASASAADVGLMLFDDDSLPLYGVFHDCGGPVDRVIAVNLASGWFEKAWLVPGGAAFWLLAHEFGHMLGLAHPHDAGGGSLVWPGTEDDPRNVGAFSINQGVFTTMSYNLGWPENPAGNRLWTDAGHPAGPMALDIAVLQDRYAAVPRNAGDTLWNLPACDDVGISWRAIWDTGGVDEIRASGGANAVIDLRPASLEAEIGGGGFVSNVHGAHGGFTIAHGVTIERARGAAGDDLLQGNGSGNRLSGDAGDDTLRGAAAGDALYGGDGGDRLFGESGADRLDGGRGNDLLNGGAGDDVLIGGTGDDVLLVGPGVDALDGGGGRDTADYIDAPAGVIVFRSGAAPDGAAAGDTLASIERLVGSPFDDSLVGDDRADYLAGGDGDDVLDGGRAADMLDGGGGHDVLSGGSGNDDLVGGGYADVLDGGGGDDKLTGGPGKDRFVFRPGCGDDVVHDLETGFDRIDLVAFGVDFAGLAISSTFENDGLEDHWVSTVAVADCEITLIGAHVVQNYNFILS